ncbi:hypothetical protein V6N11_067920 [Hibiscus sabdariffa]|uniref:Uncharacterized protein n=1 Tax=Hibiscus sabdariffa TaxID=183260 RepID=A0ABR2SS67_9ROSI
MKKSAKPLCKGDVRQLPLIPLWFAEEASKLLVTKPEQHPGSRHFKSAGIPKSAEAKSAAEPAKAGLPAAQQL